MRALLVVALAGCGASAVGPHTTTLQAPATARWTSATVITHYAEGHYTSSFTGGQNSYDDVDVELLVRIGGEGHSITLAAVAGDVFGLQGTAHDLAKLHFELAASPDGKWLVVSADGGATWVLVDPESLMLCRHFALRGRPETFWQRVPPPATVALDIVASHAGERGPLGLDHGGESATGWVLVHADDHLALVAQAVLDGEDGFTGASDRELLERMTAAVATSAAVRDQLLQSLTRARERHLHAAALATEALWNVPAINLQHALAGWIVLATARGGPRIYDYEVSNSEWEFARDVWDLARLVARDRIVDPEAERAAIGVIEHASQLLPSQEDRKRAAALGSRGRPWGMVRSVAAQAAVTYAIQILVAAHTPAARHAIEAADFDASTSNRPTLGPYADPLKDYRVFDHGDADAWFQWARDKLADVQ